MKNKLLRYYGITLGFMIILLMVGCQSTDTSKPFKYPVKCNPNNEIQYCEGNSPNSFKCRCLKIETGIFSNYRIA